MLRLFLGVPRQLTAPVPTSAVICALRLVHFPHSIIDVELPNTLGAPQLCFYLARQGLGKVAIPEHFRLADYSSGRANRKANMDLDANSGRSRITKPRRPSKEQVLEPRNPLIAIG